MIRRAALTILLALAWTPPAGAADDFAVPPPALIERMRGELDRSEWLRVATTRTSFDVHVRTVGPEGLGGIIRRRSREPIPDPIAWRMIERIDVVHSRFRSGQIMWGIAGAALGGFGPLWAKQDANMQVPLWGLVLGGVTGGWIGGKLGERNEHTEVVYVARLTASPAAADAAPLPPAGDATGSALAPAPPPPAAPSPEGAGAPSTEPAPSPDAAEIARACAELRPSNLVRIQGDFGRFVGRARRAEPGGLVGLRSASDAAPPEEPLTWDHIYSLDRRISSAGRGAVIGGTVIGSIGLLAGLVGAAAVAVAGNSDINPGEVLFGFATGGVAIGAVSGALFGSAIPRWKQVYERSGPVPAETPGR